MVLAELRQPVSRLSGIGPAKAKDFAKLGVRSIADLLQLAPRDYEDRKTRRTFRDAYTTEYANTEAEIVAHDFVGYGAKRTLKVDLDDGTGTASLLCFGRNFLQRQLPVGTRVRVAGVFRVRYGTLQSSSFLFEPAEGPVREFDSIVPIYPLAGALRQGDIRNAVRQSVGRFCSLISDDVPAGIRTRRSLRTTPQAVSTLHEPSELSDVPAARTSLAYRELFYLQLRVARQALNRAVDTGTPLRLPQTLQRRAEQRLPFRLTEDQAAALTEITADIAAASPMSRLLQGDVGSGKTLVALLSALPCVELGLQVAFLAPTELLARQHADTASDLLSPLGIHVALLSGSVSRAQRRPLIEAIAAGRAQIVVGTHAIFTSDVTFRALRLVIIDEQHRFGVLQRLAATQKGSETPDVLLMTATPIPRTLALTVFGDMHVSTIKTMPPGRKPVVTHLARHGNEQKVYDWVERELRKGRQAYFVYPLIEESESLELKDAMSTYAELSDHVFADFRLGLIHSRLGEEEKRTTMEAFKTGELDILVATSVVEVGVDVPNATCMVVEHAERFGLAALHQLRGRVGRGEHQSYAFFIYSPDLTEDGKKRLRTMLEQSDGFALAEEDLKIRGPGDFAGIRQSGYLRLRIADLATDLNVLADAREDAFALLEEDPGLISAENASIRSTLEQLDEEDPALI